MMYSPRHNAIRTRFESMFKRTIAVQWPNKELTAEEKGNCWVRVTILDTDGAWASFGDPGNNTARFPGQVVVSIFTKSGTGEGEATELVDLILPIYRSWQDAETCLRFEVPPSKRVIGPNGTWYQVNVIAPFRFDDFQ